MENTIQAKASPKHVFLHLFAIVMLYLSTANFLTLVFQYVNILLPDKLSRIGYPLFYSLNLIRFAISSIIIAFPALILTSWILNKDYKKDLAIRNMKIRKWLIYFTLFLAGLVIIGDLIRIVWIFLGGEITIRFILKSLSILFVAGIIFGYYLWDVKRDFFSPSAKLKYFVWSLSGLVVITVITGFFLIGSPQKERIRRFDQERISNLQSIQTEIVNFWAKKRVLPENLSILENSISGYKVPVDPQTNQSYEYNIKGSETFELCAAFGLPGDSDNNLEPATVPSGYSQNWQHEAGRVCFERTIDKELYPLPKD